MTQPEDPWAKWRKPANVSAEPTPEPERAPAAAPDAPAESNDAGGTVSPSGKLGVRRTAGGESSTRKRPVRGGALTRKPKAPPAPPAVKPVERPQAEARSPQAKEARTWSETKGRGRPAPGTGDQDQRRPGKDRRPLEENPWRGASAKGEAQRGKTAPRQGGSSPRPPRVEAAPAPQAAMLVNGEAPTGVRLSKVMSARGLCSRREADLWIERGWVFVNGEQISELGSRIDPDARIEVSSEAKKDQAKAVTILLHKPVGYVSGQPEPGCTPAVTLITAEAQVPQSGDPEFKPWMLRGLAPAGRLDVDSTGLLVLTSDGRVARRLIGEDSEAEKEYLVRVSGQMIKGGLDLLRHGLELDGKPLKPAWVKQLNEDQLHFILKEGKKRQIRRMCELVGLTVVGLKRVRIGRIRLADLPMGKWRFLRADEAF